jgi:integrase/recombinase XerD
MVYRRHFKHCRHRREGRRYWQCHCPIWFDARIKGRRIHKLMKSVNWEQAQDLAQVWIQKGDSTAQIDHSKGTPGEEPVSLESAWESFLAQARMRKLRPATIYKYDLLRRRMQEFAERRGLVLLKDFNLDRLEAFQSEWHEGALACSKKMERLKAFFRAAFIRRWIDDNPALALRGPKPKPPPTLPFTQREMTLILTAVEHYPDKSGKTGHDNAIRLRAFILTLRYTGMRIGDVTSLSVDRLVGNRIFLYTAKTGVPVSCVLPKFVSEALKTMPRLSEKYYFWTGNSTLHTAIGIWQRSLENLFKLAKISRGYAHRFRDTFSVELLLAGVPMEEVSILLGHSNIKITQQHYSPWVRDRQLQLEADLERAWTRDPVVQAQGTMAGRLREQGKGLIN